MGFKVPQHWGILGAKISIHDRAKYSKKKGNSNSDERMRFIEEMLKIFPTALIRCLCGDREFIGQAWLRYLLLEPLLAFCLRIRATDKIEHNGKLLAAKVIFAHLAIGESQRLQGSCRVFPSIAITSPSLTSAILLTQSRKQS
jgi:hypothetical protein